MGSEPSSKQTHRYPMNNPLEKNAQWQLYKFEANVQSCAGMGQLTIPLNGVEKLKTVMLRFC